MNAKKLPVQESQANFGDLLKARKVKKTTLADSLKLSIQTINTWVELNAVPPKHIIKVAGVLDMEIPDLLPYAKKTYKPVKSAKKTIEDLDALNDAYHGRPYQTTLSDHAIKVVLQRWGDQFPLLYDTLKALHARQIGPTEAARRLNASVSTIHGLRRRYGIAPGPLKTAKKPPKRKEINEKVCQSLAIEVISGRRSVVSASKVAGVSLRTLHRHIAPMLRPQTLNEISHWSRSFRAALATEVGSELPRYSVQWRAWAHQKGYDLPKSPRFPRPPNTREGWRKLNARQMAVQILIGNISVEELALERGGSAEVLRGLLRPVVEPLYAASPLLLSQSHQSALAEVLVALDGPKRPEFYKKAEPIRPEEL